MAFDSLDPRISRMTLELQRKAEYQSLALDQLPTYEVFLQMRNGKAYEHAGIVHAATEDMAFVFAKEQFSRRHTCTGMWVVPSERVWATECMELEENVYDHLQNIPIETDGPREEYEVFHLLKRGKQHKHAGSVYARGHWQAILQAKARFDDGKPVLNIWTTKKADINATNVDDQVIWSTLKEKTHREVISYRAGDKIKAFKERKNG
jgi:ring-1,2-phenylacetyl-CoA epoxidase subunit PaaB